MNLIVAVDKNRAIGYKGELLYRLPDDLKYFKRMTMGKTVVMGLTTFLSLPNQKPLPDRKNVVLCADKNYKRTEDILLVGSLGELAEMIKDIPSDDVFVIGGQSIYTQLADYCTNAYITLVDASAPADVFFGKIFDEPNWRLAEEGEPQQNNGIKFKFCRFVNSVPKNF